jgi:hypothetical protein
MNRIEFTWKIANLIYHMHNAGEDVLLDFAKRSDEEQQRLYDAKLSKCDGKVVLSYHQLGRAVDLYFVKDGKLGDPEKGWEYWHSVWESMDGHKMIDWDKGHFEG